MRWLVVIFLILINFPLLGQQNEVFPDKFSSYINNISLINPAFIPQQGKVNLVANYKNRTGPFSKIATYSFSGERIFRKENNSAHVARIIFWNEKEGPYIQRPRGYINYAYSLPLSENTNLSAGVTLGMAQIAFSAPSATGIGSTTMADGSLGLVLQRKKLSAGISSMQLFNSSSEAINAPIRLRRFYNFFLVTEKDISPEWTIKASVLWRLLPTVNDHFDAVLLFAYKDLFSAGSSVKYRQGLSFFANIHLNIGNDRLLIGFAYNSPVLSRSNQLLNSMELTTGYLIY